MFTTMEGAQLAQETEVLGKARRWRFTAAEKLRVLREADRCTKPGEVSSLLEHGRNFCSNFFPWTNIGVHERNEQ